MFPSAPLRAAEDIMQLFLQTEGVLSEASEPTFVDYTGDVHECEFFLIQGQTQGFYRCVPADFPSLGWQSQVLLFIQVTFYILNPSLNKQLDLS